MQHAIQLKTTLGPMLFGYLMAGSMQHAIHWLFHAEVHAFRISDGWDLLARLSKWKSSVKKSQIHGRHARPKQIVTVAPARSPATQSFLIVVTPPHNPNRTSGGCSKVLSFFPGLSQDLREAFASFRAWGFTSVGENGFSLGLEAFKDSCPGTSCVL